MATKAELARDDLLCTLAKQAWVLEELLPRHPAPRLKGALEDIIGAHQRYKKAVDQDGECPKHD